eukprot:3894089-Prymnesium_polylepis.1
MATRWRSARRGEGHRSPCVPSAGARRNSRPALNRKTARPSRALRGEAAARRGGFDARATAAERTGGGAAHWVRRRMRDQATGERETGPRHARGGAHRVARGEATQLSTQLATQLAAPPPWRVGSGSLARRGAARTVADLRGAL